MTSWVLSTDKVTENGLRLTINEQGQLLRYADVLRLWRDSTAFRAYFNDCLAELPFEAFKWETPPVTASHIERPFECVAIDSPDLIRPPDPSAFDPHFGRCSEAMDVIRFPNLGRDASLIAPCPTETTSAYAHIADFVRYAPAAQQQHLWRIVGDTLQTLLSDAPLWLSTAGAGVPWLHVRLDTTPKYYAHAPYRRAPPTD